MFDLEKPSSVCLTCFLRTPPMSFITACLILFSFVCVLSGRNYFKSLMKPKLLCISIKKAGSSDPSFTAHCSETFSYQIIFYCCSEIRFRRDIHFAPLSLLRNNMKGSAHFCLSRTLGQSSYQLQPR